MARITSGTRSMAFTVAVAVGAAAASGSIIRSAEPFVGVTQYQYIQKKGDTATPVFAREVIVNILQIDTTAAGIRFQMSGSNGATPGEVTLQKPSAFANAIGAQMVINTGFYDTQPTAPVVLPNTDLNFLTASNGDVYSTAQGGEAMFNISQTNVPTIGKAGAEGASTLTGGAAVYNATGGNQRILTGGAVSAPSGSYTNTLNPHTAIGVSQDKKKVYLAVVDGRQPDYSEGMYTTELATIMKQFGAWDAINVDGGGSTSMSMDDTNDGKKNAHLIDSPSDNATTTAAGSERAVGSSLAVFANFATGYTPLPTVPRPVTTGVLATFTATTTLDSFEGTLGHFNASVSFSGTNRNIAASSSAVVDTTVRQSGNSSLKLNIVNTNDATTPQTQLRFLSGTGSPGNNVNTADPKAMGNSGFVGFYLRALAGTGPLYVALLVDDGTTGTNGMEQGVFFPVIADGAFHLYQWDLSEDGTWKSFAGLGNNLIDGPNVFIDSILFSSAPAISGGPNVSATVWLDSVMYNPNGRLDALVPEPASLAALVGLGGIVVRRRRAV